MIPVSAHGQYAVQIENSRKFLVKLVGTMSEFNKEKLKEYFRGLILTIAKTTIAKKMGGNTGLSVLEIATQLTDISDAIKAELNDQLEEFGLKLVNFFELVLWSREFHARVNNLNEHGILTWVDMKPFLNVAQCNVLNPHTNSFVWCP